MELKVVCYCGQKYKFDVEPVDGQMPFAVNCPVCNVDGTPLANQLLREQVSGIPQPAPIVAAPLVAPLPTPAPAAPMPMALPAIGAPQTGGSGVRIRMSTPASTPPSLAAPSAPPPLAAPAPAATPKPITPVKPAAAPKVQKEFSMGMGILGALLGAAVGAGLTYAFFTWVGFRFPWTGVGIGALSGYGARLLGRGTDTTLGAIAAAIAGIAIVGVFYLMYGGFFMFGIISIIICIGVAYRLASE